MQNPKSCRLPLNFPASAKSSAGSMHTRAVVTVEKRGFTSPVGIILLYHLLHNLILLFFFFLGVGNIDYTFMLSFATVKMQTAILPQNAVFLNYCALKPQRSPRGALLSTFLF